MDGTASGSGSRPLDAAAAASHRLGRGDPRVSGGQPSFNVTGSSRPESVDPSTLASFTTPDPGGERAPYQPSLPRMREDHGPNSSPSAAAALPSLPGQPPRESSDQRPAGGGAEGATTVSGFDPAVLMTQPSHGAGLNSLFVVASEAAGAPGSGAGGSTAAASRQSQSHPREPASPQPGTVSLTLDPDPLSEQVRIDV